jgi:hypothetical protein
MDAFAEATCFPQFAEFRVVSAQWPAIIVFATFNVKKTWSLQNDYWYLTALCNARNAFEARAA